MRASVYQKRFWVEWQLNPQSTTYNESFFYNIKGPLNLDLLKLAFNSLSHKHPLLRSQFFESNSKLYIQPVKNYKPPFEIVDIDLSQSVSINDVASQVINIPFDLRNGPLWQAKVLRLDEQQYWLVISFHHIILDGNSFEVLRNDLSRFYNHPDVIKQLKSVEEYNLDLETYIETESTSKTSHLISQGLQYYAEKLVGKSLYYDVHTSSDDRTTFFFSLDAKASKQIKSFCLKNNCKPFRFVATVFAIFLYRYFGRKEFCMTYPVNMRQNGGGDILGCFINMQLLPVILDPKFSFEQVFAQIVESRKATQELKLPYEKIIEYLKQQNIVGLSDSVNVVVSETDLKLRSIHLNGLQVSSIQVPKTFLPYDLALEYECYEGNIYLQLSIKNHWFSAEHHSKQLQQDFNFIIDRACKYFQTSLEQLPRIQPMQLEVMRNQSFNSKLLDIRLDQKFDQVVRQYPNKIAIIDSDKKITYLQLSQMVDVVVANMTPKLSDEITKVGISMRHSTELVAVMIALFKLGITYLPIRPDLPVSYANELITHSELKLIITDHVLNYEVDLQCSISDLLTEVLVIKNYNKNHDNETAYILYTSGTTGIPKGVMVKHTSIVNLIASCQPFYHISDQDVIPMFHSYGFDFSVWEIWSALLNGATLLILDEFITKSPKEFTKYIGRYGVTAINQTPTALKQWMSYLSETYEVLPDLSSVRAIITGGEALYPHHVEGLLHEKTPLRCQIFNMYGITEDAVHSTIFEVTSSYLKQQHSILGKMLPGKYGLVVDERNNIKPMGCPGELVISGFGVAQGYFNQVSMTEEKFIQLAGIDFQKIWLKTGDQVRLLPSGEFEYIGRKDTQIKIRGYRIDYRDIEVRLSRLKGVQDIKVIVDNDKLLAFVVLTSHITISDISTMAKAGLPHYMVPSRFIKVDVLPRTINNKIDEKKLFEISNLKQEMYFSTPHQTSDTTLLQIVKVWETLLPNRVFELNDNFFDCGGNSILLVALQQHLEKQFSVELPIINFFSSPTIADMAKMVKQCFNNPRYFYHGVSYELSKK